MNDPKARGAELSCEEHRRILDEIADAGCLWLLYTGGEIFARDDFLDIYTYAKQKGLLITLFTNGTLITPQIADHLAEWRPFSIEITIYGRTKETHERVTGVSGSYEQCMQGVRLLMERRLPLVLKTMAITLNKHEIWEMKRFAEEDLGLKFRFDATINCRIDCSRSPLGVRLTPPEIVELDLQDPKRVAEWKKFAERFGGSLRSGDQARDLYCCGAGITGYAIDPYGRLGVCALSRSDTWDLRKGSFQDGWERFLFAVRQKKITTQTRCVACEIKAMCGMCPGNGQLENGDAEAPADFLCEVAHLRAKAFGLPVAPHGECIYCDEIAGIPNSLTERSILCSHGDVAMV
jgi:radical SAM protein with 4Fe4S-binding SPASM domain